MDASIVGVYAELSLQSRCAHLAELVDALVLGTSGLGRGGSSPPVGINVFLGCRETTFWGVLQPR